MTGQVALKDAKNRLSALVRDAERGHTSIITRNGKPVADIVPHVAPKGGIDFDALKRWEDENGGPLVLYVAPNFDDPLSDSFWFPDN